MCRYADGYQPHLVSPDKGVHALCQEAMDLVAGPVKSCVHAVHSLLLTAARCGGGKAEGRVDGEQEGSSETREALHA